MTYLARVTEDGRLALPEQLARDLGLRPGDMLAVERSGRSLVLTREAEPNAAIERLRQAMRGYSVDQFLAERREDWGE